MYACQKHEMGSVRDKWLCMCAVRDIILSNNGIIFGGFVRDSIMHDAGAQKFYKKFPRPQDRFRYNDSSYDISSNHRLILPNDIDVSISERNYTKFVEDMKVNRFNVIELFSHDPMHYFPSIDVEDPSLQHIKLLIQINFSAIRHEIALLPMNSKKIRDKLEGIISSPQIYVDILRSKKPYNDPFISKIDFECNGLFQTKFGTGVASLLLKDAVGILAQNQVKDKIIKDIIDNRAILVTPFDYRILKMSLKGFLITIEHKIFEEVEEYNDKCCVCCELLCGIHVKLKCCSMIYHHACLASVMTTNPVYMKACCTCKREHLCTVKDVNILTEIQRIRPKSGC